MLSALLPVRKFRPSDDDVVPSPQGMPELGIDQLGQRRRVGFVADVPGLKPSQLGVGCAGAGFDHLGQAQVDRVGQDCCQQQVLVLSQVARFQVGEVAGGRAAAG